MNFIENVDLWELERNSSENIRSIENTLDSGRDLVEIEKWFVETLQGLSN